MNTLAPLVTAEELSALTVSELADLDWRLSWQATARAEQLPPSTPDGQPFNQWGLLAGRGFGKTRTGAEWLGRAAFDDPLALPSAVVAPTLNDVRFTCFEGKAGLLAVIPPEHVKHYASGDRVLLLTNGATIRGFGSDAYERLRGPEHTRVWADELCLVSGTYVTTPTGHKCISECRRGDLVMTRKGPRRVARAWKTSDHAETWEATTSDGRVLRGTAGHPVWVEGEGFVPLHALQRGCRLLTWDMHRASSGTANSGTTTETTTVTAEGGSCTARSTSPRMAPSPRTSTSTTSMVTRSTTRLRTFRHSLDQTTSASTGPVASPHARQKSYGLRRWLSGAASSLSSACVSTVAWASSPPPPLPSTAAARVGAARTTFRASGSSLPGSQRSTCRGPEAASSAQQSTAPPTPDRSAAPGAADTCIVLSVERTNRSEAVYNIEVEGEHEYFANGLLTHNCAWLYPQETWDMMTFGLRLGAYTQVVWTTTPKPIALVRDLIKPQPGRVITRGTTYDNKENLSTTFFDELVKYEGTVIGRQELMGEMIDPEEAGIIRRSWFKLWPAGKPLPDLEWIVMSLDTAFTAETVDRKTGDPDYSACTVWGVFVHEDRRSVMLLDCWQERLGLPDLIERVKKEQKYTYGDDQDRALIKPKFGSNKPLLSGRSIELILIEDKGSGISLRQTLERDGLLTYGYNPGRADKLSRLHIVSQAFKNGRVWLPESTKMTGKPISWCDEMVSQLCSFTGARRNGHDDYVDSTTQAIRLFMDKGMLDSVALSKRPPPPAPRERRENPYSR